MERSLWKKGVVVLLILALLPYGGLAKGVMAVENKKQFVDNKKHYVIDIMATSEWENGYTAQVKITNTGENTIKNWSIVSFISGEVVKSWNIEYIKEEREYIFCCESHNREIAPNKSVEFGIEVKNGCVADISSMEIKEGNIDQIKDYEVKYEIKNSWEHHAIIEATIKNTGKKVLRDWKLQFLLDGAIETIWNADIIGNKGNQYVLVNKGYNADIGIGESVTLGFQINYETKEQICIPSDSVLYSVSEKEQTESEEEESIDWYKTLIRAEDDSVVEKRDNVKNKVKIALLDSGVDFTDTIDVEERVNFVENYEESNPLFDDLSGHGTATAGIIVSDSKKPERLEKEEQELQEEDTEEAEELDFSFLQEEDELTAVGDEKEITTEETSLPEEIEEADISEEYDDIQYEEMDSEGNGTGVYLDNEEPDMDNEEDSEDNPLFALNEKYGEIEGINKNVLLYSGRVLDADNQAPVSRVVEGIHWAIEKEVNIINISWGCKEDNKELHKAIQEANDKGILVIAAAGNEGQVEYPAKYEEVMAVGAVDSMGKLVKGSAVGEGIDVVAPGEQIAVYGFLGGITKASGSSIAAPQVTALAAILWQQDITKSHHFIRQLINLSANCLGDRKHYGYGLIDCKQAVESYEEFASVYQEKASLVENEVEAAAQQVIVQEEQVVVVDASYVKGLWEHHDGIIPVEGALKEGLTWPDNEASRIKGMTNNPLFHGSSSKDYVHAYLFMSKAAAHYAKTGKWINETKSGAETALSKGFYKALSNATYDSVSAEGQPIKKSRMDTPQNEEERQQNAIFAYGLAMHTMGDVFSHASWGIKDIKGNNTSVKDTPRFWVRQKHGDRANDGKLVDNRADSTILVPKRYEYTTKLYKEVVKHRVNKQMEGSPNDFIYKGSWIFTTSKKTSKRKNAVLNWFGISGFKKYLKANKGNYTSAKVKSIDNASLKKKFNKWQRVQISIEKNTPWGEGSQCIVYQQVKKNQKYENIEAEKQGKSFYFWGDIGKTYIIRITSVKDGKKSYITKYLKVKRKAIPKTATRDTWVSPLDKEKAKEYNLGDSYEISLKQEYLFAAKKYSIKKKELSKKATLTGKVTYYKTKTDKQPLKGATITLTDINNPGNTKKVKSKANGQYSFGKGKKLAPGIYEIKITKKNYKTATAKIVVTSNQKNVYNRTIALVEKGGGIGVGGASGKISSAETGKGVGRLTLQIRQGFDNVDGDIVQQVQSDAGGNYWLSNLEAGYYTGTVVDERGFKVEETYLNTSFDITVLGGETLSKQNAIVSHKLTQNQLRIVLSWGEKPKDLDSHLLGTTTDGKKGHLYFGRKQIVNANGDTEFQLDVDDINSYGPETVTIYNPSDDDYQYYVYNYSHRNDTELRESEAMVRVYRGNSNVPWYTFYVPQEDGYCWNVFRYDGENKRLYPNNEISYIEPGR